ncbi:hypothetical protein RFI_16204 [Reticulomyxa filosa]|uniref:Uncharacterized protein n=1 Tax=Reticulomyxa filosa TaxID=46433 RepID=X6N6S2_RETFI|nr:hypothetical protein RFI_16204 [Reticulomyxa filosa]|eukprot:ETO20997.1 hypothetical protein RFI_16204 [Reticulomyxa filosa]
MASATRTQTSTLDVLHSILSVFQLSMATLEEQAQMRIAYQTIEIISNAHNRDFPKMLQQLVSMIKQTEKGSSLQEDVVNRIYSLLSIQGLLNNGQRARAVSCMFGLLPQNGASKLSKYLQVASDLVDAVNNECSWKRVYDIVLKLCNLDSVVGSLTSLLPSPASLGTCLSSNWSASRPLDLDLKSVIKPMTLSHMTLSHMTLSHMTLSPMTLSPMTLSHTWSCQNDSKGGDNSNVKAWEDMNDEQRLHYSLESIQDKRKKRIVGCAMERICSGVKLVRHLQKEKDVLKCLRKLAVFANVDIQCVLQHVLKCQTVVEILNKSDSCIFLESYRRILDLVLDEAACTFGQKQVFETALAMWNALEHGNSNDVYDCLEPIVKKQISQVQRDTLVSKIQKICEKTRAMHTGMNSHVLTLKYILELPHLVLVHSDKTLRHIREAVEIVSIIRNKGWLKGFSQLISLIAVIHLPSTTINEQAVHCLHSLLCAQQALDKKDTAIYHALGYVLRLLPQTIDANSLKYLQLSIDLVTLMERQHHPDSLVSIITKVCNMTSITGPLLSFAKAKANELYISTCVTSTRDLNTYTYHDVDVQSSLEDSKEESADWEDIAKWCSQSSFSKSKRMFQRCQVLQSRHELYKRVEETIFLTVEQELEVKIISYLNNFFAIERNNDCEYLLAFLQVLAQERDKCFISIFLRSLLASSKTEPMRNALKQAIAKDVASLTHLQYHVPQLKQIMQDLNDGKVGNMQIALSNVTDFVSRSIVSPISDFICSDRFIGHLLENTAMEEITNKDCDFYDNFKSLKEQVEPFVRNSSLYANKRKKNSQKN